MFALELIELYAVTLLFLSVTYYVRSVLDWRRRSRGRPLPPGPPPWPIVGNLYNAPHHRPWIGYRDLCKQYGNIVHLRFLGGTRVVVLGSPDVISEALEKRSVNTSDKKQSPLLDLAGAGNNFAFMPYGQYWRRHRRAFWQYFTPNAISRYPSVQCEVVHAFLRKVLRAPADLKEHIRFTFTGTMMRVVYDIDDDEEVYTCIEKVDTAQEGVGQGLIPGRYLVELLPFLRYFPSWFPGARPDPMFTKWMAASSYLQHVPVERVKKAMVQGAAKNYSMVGNLLAKLAKADFPESQSGEEELVIKNVASLALQAGSDTLYSTLQGALLAISQHPEVLKKAQDELDIVVGPDRLPNFSDREQLVYVNAIVKETLRSHNVTPLAMPHYTVEDDEWGGYFIPAGTIILPNAWACLHDPQTYGDPDEFRPERFISDGKLDPTVLDPMQHAFGYGRRICPGRYFADAGLFINIASMLHVFDISPPLDSGGRPIKVERVQTDGLMSYPEGFTCVIKPRSPEAEALILRTQMEDTKGKRK